MNAPRIVVVGAGHAGIEAASAAARMGARTTLVTLNLETIGRMSCNPAIGGIAKGNLVVELDALGGVMGKAADACGIQFRVLNRSRGPAVWGLRAQEDREAYARWMRNHVMSLPGLQVRQGVVSGLRSEGGRITGVDLMGQQALEADAVVVTTGTFLNGLIHIGSSAYPGGRANEPASTELSRSLLGLGLNLGRFKTGTPPRVLASSVRLDALPAQPGDADPLPFSLHTRHLPNRQVDCHLTHTHPALHALVRENLSVSPLYSGQITGTGPRYCPSLEVKIVKFPDRERHAIFVEPEGIGHPEVYLNGLSMSLPFSVQEAVVRMLPGFENAVITRPAYAIEYDVLRPDQLTPSLEVRQVPGLFLAGQINGTSGYEEAAAQGLMAGLNAVRMSRGEEPVILGRDQAYIGILIDDLVRTQIAEPYRMFTSRAEYRLQLGFRSARRRLLPTGRRLGLIPERTYRRIMALEERIEALASLADRFPVTPSLSIRERLRGAFSVDLEDATTLGGLHRRTRLPLERLAAAVDFAQEADPLVWSRAGEDILYAPYRERQREEVERLNTLWRTPIPERFAFDGIPGLSREVEEKLSEARPRTLGEARSLPGMTPAALTALYVAVALHPANA